MKLVVDASVALKWFLADKSGEEHLAQAEAVATAIEHGETEFFAPLHWTAEIIGVLARIEPGAVDDTLLVLDDMKPTLIDGVPVLRRAADLAITLDHHLFDTLYHAVALETGATLVTADDTYFNKARDLGSIQRLADFVL
jgi:predicted nucleic acid-binding protein